MVDNQGVTTARSALNAAKVVTGRKLESVMVVTQYFHVPRSKLAVVKAGVPTVHGVHARYFELRDFYSIAREVPAYLRYWLL